MLISRDRMRIPILRRKVEYAMIQLAVVNDSRERSPATNADTVTFYNQTGLLSGRTQDSQIDLRRELIPPLVSR